MANKSVWRIVAICVIIGLMASDAAAWGPRARRSIAGTALQLLRRQYMQEFFQDGDFVYQRDLIQGALAGPDVIIPDGVSSEHEAIAAITNEMALLRDARRYGVGSYYAYRMGALSSLVSDMFLPFALGIEPGMQASELRNQVAADVDDRISNFMLRPELGRLQFIGDPVTYFREQRRIAVDAVDMIATDYRTGVGAQGYLARGGEQFFRKAVVAVSDTWHTTLTTQHESRLPEPSREKVTWYLVDQIEFLLMEKGNLREAERTYVHFASVNPGIVEAYERVGDHFYEFGARSRGVEEWRLAANFSGPGRQRVIEKLGNHYIDVGRDHLAAAESPDGPERALDEAIEAFRQALSVDRTSEEAAELLSEATIAKKEKDERRQTVTEIVASMSTVMQEANMAADRRAYETALNLFERVQSLGDGVDDEFQEQRRTAEQLSADAAMRVTSILNRILDEAQDAIDDGQAYVDQNMFDEAEDRYRSVPGILAAIPDEPGSRHTETKQQLIDLAQQRLSEVDMARRRWQEEQQRLAEQAAQQQAGGAPQPPAQPQQQPPQPGPPGGPQMPPGPPGGPQMPPGPPGAPQMPGPPGGGMP